MQRKIFALGVGCALVVGLLAQIVLPGWTRIELTDGDTGRVIHVAVARDGELLTLDWHNSLFDLDVTEEFVADSGRIIQTSVTFADPRGVPPMLATPQDLDDLYHTGGPFVVRGLRKPFTQIIYRIGEIGNPQMRIRDRVVDFKREVGFGGRIVLATRAPRAYEIVGQTRLP